jgi:hypothetical protein
MVGLNTGQDVEWGRVHAALTRLAAQKARADAEEGRWLLAAWRAAVHVHVGCANFAEYVERLLGYQPRSTQEKLRVATALEELPELAQALTSGTLNWCAVRELTRVAVPETEREWIAVARGKRVHQLAELVVGKRPGDVPSSPADPTLRRHVLRFEVSPETFALCREALSSLRRNGDQALDDDSALLAIARHVLGGPSDAGRASYQVVMSVCQQCGAGAQHANGELVEVAPEVVSMTDCDRQLIVPVGESAHVDARARQSIPPARRRAVLLRDRHRCRVPGCRNATFVDVHHIILRSEGGSHATDNLITLCGAHHRAAHVGALRVEGSVACGLSFRHADGSAYGEPIEPATLDAHAKVFSALCNMGFRESEARAALEHLTGAACPMSIEALLRAALERLARPRRQAPQKKGALHESDTRRPSGSH